MSRLIYDIESDGLLDAMTTVHCIVTRDIDTGLISCYYDVQLDCPEYPATGSIAAGVEALCAAKLRVGHYIQGFDEPALAKFYGLPREYDAARVFDTKVAAAVLWPDEHMKAMDYIRKAQGRSNGMPGNLYGRHSLEAWGFRLKVHKSDFGKQTDWKALSPEMLRYCVQDTRVTADLFAMLQGQVTKCRASLETLSIENEFAARIQEQQLAGFRFDLPAAQDLSVALIVRRAQLMDEISKSIPPFIDEYVTPKKKLKRFRKTLFNPGSHQHVARHLKERLGWEPEEFTPTGIPQVTDVILDKLDYPSIEGLREFFKLQKILGMLSEGDSAWLKLVKDDGRLHGYVGHNSAVTGRCTHSKPNVTQVPRIKSVKVDGKKTVVKGWKGGFGHECRSLFVTRPGWKLVGCDAAGLELRMLAHFLAKHDGGEYVKTVTTGDVHTANMLAAGLNDRDQAKTFIYAFLYGAGNGKLGKVLKRSTEQAKKTRAQFLKNLPALRKLLVEVQSAAAQNKVLRIPSGRLLHVRSEHGALNLLFQGTGALVMKVACILAHRAVQQDLGLKLYENYAQVHMAHDEFQFETEEPYAEAVGKCLQESIRKAGEYLGLRCPLDGTYTVGNTWAETH